MLDGPQQGPDLFPVCRAADHAVLKQTIERPGKVLQNSDLAVLLDEGVNFQIIAILFVAHTDFC